MKFLLTGGAGMLATALRGTLAAAGHEIDAPDRHALDVTDASRVRERIREFRPDVVVHCAAYTAVDRAEAEPDLARLVNATATGYVADACQDAGALLVYPSTDYVFDGRGRRPYRPDDPAGPVNAYGRSKLAGEEAAKAAGRLAIVRTSWLYGDGGANFVDTMARLCRERDEVDVVDDQTGRPTWTGTLADAVRRLAEAGAEGVFHATAGGEPVTWYGLAQEIVNTLELPARLRPVGTEAFARPAPRPRYSVLDCTATELRLGESFEEWKVAVARYLRRGTR